MNPLRNYLRQARRNVERQLIVRKDPATGLLYQQMYGSKVFLRDYGAYIPQRDIDWLCRDVYFRDHLPGHQDTVVDIGAGYGHEALYCQMRSPGLRYIGVEVQPSVYECLANTFAPYRSNLKAYPRAISNESVLYLDSASGSDYEDVQTTGNGAVEVATSSWEEFKDRFVIDRISLLKVNIEGGERYLLPTLGSLSEVDRVIISAHDFRAERGEGEHFRTREFVLDYLNDAGFAPRSLQNQYWWRDWIYAERTSA